MWDATIEVYIHMYIDHIYSVKRTNKYTFLTAAMRGHDNSAAKTNLVIQETNKNIQ